MAAATHPEFALAISVPRSHIVAGASLFGSIVARAGNSEKFVVKHYFVTYMSSNHFHTGTLCTKPHRVIPIYVSHLPMPVP